VQAHRNSPSRFNLYEPWYITKYSEHTSYVELVKHVIHPFQDFLHIIYWHLKLQFFLCLLPWSIWSNHIPDGFTLLKGVLQCQSYPDTPTLMKTSQNWLHPNMKYQSWCVPITRLQIHYCSTETHWKSLSQSNRHWCTHFKKGHIIFANQVVHYTQLKNRQ